VGILGLQVESFWGNCRVGKPFCTSWT